MHYHLASLSEDVLNILVLYNITNIWFWNYNPRRIETSSKQIPYSNFANYMWCRVHIIEKTFVWKVLFRRPIWKSRTRPEIRNSIDVFTKSNFMFLTTFDKKEILNQTRLKKAQPSRIPGHGIGIGKNCTRVSMFSQGYFKITFNVSTSIVRRTKFT